MELGVNLLNHTLERERERDRETERQRERISAKKNMKLDLVLGAYDLNLSTTLPKLDAMP